MLERKKSLFSTIGETPIFWNGTLILGIKYSSIVCEREREFLTQFGWQVMLLVGRCWTLTVAARGAS